MTSAEESGAIARRKKTGSLLSLVVSHEYIMLTKLFTSIVVALLTKCILLTNHDINNDSL